MNFGDSKINYQVLDENRIKLLDKLAEFKNDFYLAGGTALALQIGHRVSVDFDFFTSAQFKNEELIQKIKNSFHEYSISIIQNERDTVTILLDDLIKLSFFCLSYSNILPFLETQYFNLTQVKEIGVMKLVALFRATYKDYVDIYFILQKYELKELINLAEKKHPNFDKTIYLKALISFDDVDDSPITFFSSFETDRNTVFTFIEKKVIEYIGR